MKNRIDKVTIEYVINLLSQGKKEQMISMLSILKQDSIIKRIKREGMPKYILMSPDMYKNIHHYFDHILPVKESLISQPGTFLFSWADDFLFERNTHRLIPASCGASRKMQAGLHIRNSEHLHESATAPKKGSEN